MRAGASPSSRVTLRPGARPAAWAVAGFSAAGRAAVLAGDDIPGPGGTGPASGGGGSGGAGGAGLGEGENGSPAADSAGAAGGRAVSGSSARAAVAADKTGGLSNSGSAWGDSSSEASVLASTGSLFLRRRMTGADEAEGLSGVLKRRTMFSTK